ncbi:hypothetical protein HDA32_003257 [Spinactinospora alkalitolerans]|uniref:DUF742 domain-containing protein n=1 Tax=Spinactinospora alkalitolerans TaxID=687207 RepID=A0A852TXX7_9ACTN|nr:DUF742 domain-containing protein [Spinactinospora alkalitolerans]NYE48137.1 hypothetical protein [Spinactinospora alkalitolerans]
MLQTLVSTMDPSGGPPQNLMPESQDICLLCRESGSVAEISAKLRIPVGVVQVLLSDLADQGLVYIHPTITGNSPADNRVLERALRGLERLFQ